ncbi:Cytochrome P450 61 [Aspergillus niger]|uniref:Cytochrome P450 61 n=1 Tax=Aspergillus niger TaxID=5061 RepID=A0A505IT76_ASPNG|nr:Cytochrome P450 61 [Aspergillus niger]
MAPPTTSPPKTIKTSLLLLSDTHTLTPLPPIHPNTSTPFRHPLPATDLLIHAGDLTKVGHKHEHLTTLSFLKSARAPIKLIIPGNHDITLDEPYYKKIGHYRHRYRTDHTAPSATSGSDNVSAGKGTPGMALSDDELREIKELYTGKEAWDAGIRYLEEGTHVFRLQNGAVLRVYAMPDYPGVDVMITHGPPYGVLDQVVPNHMSVGCEHLYRAVKRARPRVHVFGHIHEGYGATRREWSSGNESVIQCDKERTLEERCARVDVSKEGGNGLRVGEETLFVNASVVTVQYQAINAPWVVEVDLPVE